MRPCSKISMRYTGVNKGVVGIMITLGILNSKGPPMDGMRTRSHIFLTRPSAVQHTGLTLSKGTKPCGRHAFFHVCICIRGKSSPCQAGWSKVTLPLVPAVEYQVPFKWQAAYTALLWKLAGTSISHKSISHYEHLSLKASKRRCLSSGGRAPTLVTTCSKQPPLNMHKGLQASLKTARKVSHPPYRERPYAVMQIPHHMDQATNATVLILNESYRSVRGFLIGTSSRYSTSDPQHLIKPLPGRDTCNPWQRRRSNLHKQTSKLARKETQH